MIDADGSPVKEQPGMTPLSRRDFLALSLAAAAGLAHGAPGGGGKAANVHRQLLDLAAAQEKQRRARFAAVRTPNDLAALQKSLRASLLGMIGGLPEAKGPPPAKRIARIEADDYLVDKLVFESFPGYFVSALLYRPRKVTAALPGVLSPCGHSAVGKAAPAYQTLHINLAMRGFVVLTYDPVGQGERSQFWDAAKGRSRFNLTCGEHCVLGNPLYLLGANLARFRIWDGVRGLDYLASLPEVDAKRLGCVGNSGGGTLTAYIAALDPRVAVAAICCYITTLPRRMGNRIQADPDADPEQDLFGFVSEGLDHAGLLALRAPRPTLLGTARLDFFPIEGARESFAEAQHLFGVAGAGKQVERAEANERHGLTLPLRRAVYDWFDRWLAGRPVKAPAEEVKVTPRPAKDLLVCAQGQVNLAFQSRHLLPLALEEFQRRKPAARVPVRDVLRLDPQDTDALVTEVNAGKGQTLVVLVNGNEARDWREEKEVLQALTKRGDTVQVVDPRGVGKLRPDLAVRGHDYADPLAGVEENIAYNAFLVGKTLVGMRVTDVLEVVRRTAAKVKPKRVVLCGRRDAGLVALFAAAAGPAVDRVAAEEVPLSLLPWFAADTGAVNAASVVPGLLRDCGDLPDVLAQVAPRRVLVAAPTSKSPRALAHVQVVEGRFSTDARLLTDWLGK
jgi:cephalosporin-C deacetylase-like acetyl esterase